VAGPLERDTEVVLERRHFRRQLHGTSQRPHRVVERLLVDEHQAQVVHRPHVGRVEHQRLVVGRDRLVRLSLGIMGATDQPVRFAQRFVDPQHDFEHADRRIGLIFIEQHPAQVQVALHVRRIEDNCLPQ
jgi:hypothetical protein